MKMTIKALVIFVGMALVGCSTISDGKVTVKSFGAGITFSYDAQGRLVPQVDHKDGWKMAENVLIHSVDKYGPSTFQYMPPNVDLKQ